LYAELESSIETEEFMPYKGVLREVVKKAGVKFGFIPDDKEVNLLVNSIGYWKPFDDTILALRALKERFRLAVISNIDDDLFEITQSKLGIEFDCLVTAQQVRAYKPDLSVFRFSIEKLGVKKEGILHIAQSLYHDISPANELGIKTVWVNRRHDKEGFGATPMASADPDVEVPDLASLVRLIEKG
jgi:2-haloacid dehalogenase